MLYVYFFKEMLETSVSSLIKRSQSNERERVRAGKHLQREVVSMSQLTR